MSVEPAGYEPDEPGGLREHSEAWHLGRIRYFVERLNDGDHVDAILIDDPCSGGYLTGQPTVTDGHHRLAAHLLTGQHTILAGFSGKVSTLRWLRGILNVPQF